MNNPTDGMTVLNEPRAQASTSVRSPESRWAWPCFILLLALALRIFHLRHESVSGDEAFSITLTRDPMGVMMHRLVLDLVHPPLHYLALRGWLKLFGFGLLQARVLSVIFGTLAIVFLYLLAEYLFDRRTALLSALLMAVSQLAIMFSQEARPYAQMHLLALASAYLFLRAWREERALYWWGFVACSVLLIYTNYFGVFLIAALLLVAVIYRQRYRLHLGWALGGAAVTLLLYTPWLTSGIVRRALQPGNVARQTAEYAAVHWWTFVSILNSFNNGKPAGLRSDSPWWTVVVGGLLFTAPLLLLLKKLLREKADAGEQHDREGIVIAGILWLLPIVLTLLSGKAFHVPYNVRYVSFCAAFYYVLVARAVFELPLHVLRWGLVALILLYSANALRANYFMRWKEYWDEGFAYVEANRKDGDCGIFPPDYKVLQPWEVTQAGHPSLFRVISQESFASGAPGCGRVWEVVPAPRDDWRQWSDYKKKNPVPAIYTKIAEQRYYGMRVTLYLRKEQ
jgi:4-amino-4-deoxy-L-arabinose transferase-like glycosyltransferase